MTRTLLLAATILAPVGFSMQQAAAQPVTGLYIGAGGGVNFMQKEQVTVPVVAGQSAVGSTAFDHGYVALGSVGWGFGNGLRLELEGNYRHNRFDTPNGTASVSSGGTEKKYGAMFNALFDLDVGSPYVFPYFGGGVGYGRVEQRSRASFNSPFLPSESVTTRLYEGSFAYQAIGGASFPIPGVVGLSLTAEYRFYALAGDRTGQTTLTGVPGIPTTVSSFRTKSDYNHDLMIGIRYAFNVAPPPVAAAPAPAPVTAARTYLVFFDWDRADLTDRARQIIAEAANASQRVAVTRIEVSGNTDTSGTARYNLGLSERRARTVAAELVRLGVPRAAITTQGYGSSRPLVATGPGVREPQNRRVEIVLQ